MIWLFLCLVLFPWTLLAQEIVPADSLVYRSDFHHSEAEIDSLLSHSPQIVLLTERIRLRNRRESFLGSTTLHFSYNPLDEQVPEKSTTRFWIGISLPLGRFFQNAKKLDQAEFAAALIALRVEARRLLKEREELLAELELEIQRYHTAAFNLQKKEAALKVNEVSSDEVLEAKDNVAELLTKIKKKKLAIRFVEDRLKALIGEL